MHIICFYKIDHGKEGNIFLMLKNNQKTISLLGLTPARSQKEEYVLKIELHSVKFFIGVLLQLIVIT